GWLTKSLRTTAVHQSLPHRRPAVVHPQTVVEPAALVDPIVGEGRPRHTEARGDAGRQNAVLGLGEQPLDVGDEALALARVLLNPRLLDHSIDLGVARLVALACRIDAVKGDPALRPELRGQRADGVVLA